MPRKKKSGAAGPTAATATTVADPFDGARDRILAADGAADVTVLRDVVARYVPADYADELTHDLAGHARELRDGGQPRDVILDTIKSLLVSSPGTPPAREEEAEDSRTGSGTSSETATVAPADAAEADRPARRWARSFRSFLTLPSKGATVGTRDGHDWVIAFPQDPGPQIKEQLADAGFAYRARDRKWTTFTHAPNRPPVEALAKRLRAEFGDEVAIADYPTKQVVVSFDERPGDEVTARLKENGFHYRADQTWNADLSPAAQDFARELVRGLPDKARSVAG